MRAPLTAFVFALAFLSIVVVTAGQQIPVRDPQALTILQNSVNTMGSTVPSDSVATGTVTVVAGSLTENGTVRILTRGTDQTLEQITTPTSDRTVIYSQGVANVLEGTTVKMPYLERAASSQCTEFPVPIIDGLLSNPDVALSYIGLESLNGVSVQHVHAWNTYASQPDWQSLADFTAKDIWIDVSSDVPVRLSYLQRDTGGNASQGIPIDVFYSNYQNTGGVLYPYTVNISANGTPWMVIQTNTVLFNTGLTDSDFPIVLVQP